MRHKPPVWVLLLVLAAGSSLSAAQAPSVQQRDPAPKGDYKIGVEDLLEIVVWGEENLSLETRVRPDGKITVPLVNDVLVRDKTPTEVVATITEKLKQYVRDPHVTVHVKEINSFRVFFLGEVNKPGVIQLYRPTRLLQAIAMAGGLTEFSKNDIIVHREQNGRQLRIAVNYKQLASGEKPETNIHLKPGDTVVVR